MILELAFVLSLHSGADEAPRTKPTRRKPPVSAPKRAEPVPESEEGVWADERPPEMAKAEPCDTCGSFMHERDARLLYKDFSATQFPRGAVFAFDTWAVPPDSRCANTRDTGNANRRVSCTVCSEATDPEERVLTVNALKGFAVVEEDFVFKFEGKTGPFSMKCGPKGAWRSPIDVVEDLRALGVGVRFRYPKEAQLRSAPSGTPDSAK